MGLLNERRRVMGGKELPYDAEVDYLESSEENGITYIQLDYIPNDADLDMWMDFEFMGYRSVGSYQDWIGTHSLSAGRIYNIERRGSNNNTIDIYWAGTSLIQTNVKAGTRYKIVVSSAKKTISFNEVSLALPKTSDATNIYPFRLIGTSATNVLGKLYSFRLDKAGKTVLDLIPVRKGDEGYMYDKVSGKLYGNAGEGRFVLGKDV